MKKAIVFFLLTGLTITLGAQSVADLARREKERRESLGRRAPVITNIDLLRLKKKAAMDIPPSMVDLDEFYAEEEPEQAEEISPPESVTPDTTAPPAEVPAPPAEGPSLEDQLQTVVDWIDLLATKIQALKMSYSAQENMVPNYVIEQQLDETLARLRAAEVEEARIRGEIDRRDRERRSPAGTVR